MDQQEKTTTMNAVRDIEQRIAETKQLIETRRELITEYTESMQEWLEVEAAKEELTRVRQVMASKLSRDGEYNNMLEDLGQLKEDIKSQKETLSDLIVGYFASTKERQIETESNGDARDLIIKGSLGKKSKYQTNIFTGNRSE